MRYYSISIKGFTWDAMVGVAHKLSCFRFGREEKDPLMKAWINNKLNVYVCMGAM